MSPRPSVKLSDKMAKECWCKNPTLWCVFVKFLTQSCRFSQKYVNKKEFNLKCLVRLDAWVRSSPVCHVSFPIMNHILLTIGKPCLVNHLCIFFMNRNLIYWSIGVNYSALQHCRPPGAAPAAGKSPRLPLPHPQKSFIAPPRFAFAGAKKACGPN